MSVMRWLRTVRYLRPVQIYGRLWFSLYRPAPDLSSAPPQRAHLGDWIKPPQHRASLLRPWRFCFLNEEHDLDGANGWDNPKHSKLWRYNLHYFDDLNAPADAQRHVWHGELLLRWLCENPPAQSIGWESYPTSLRIVNWIKWSLAGNTFPEQCVHSLAIQARWLSKRLEVHLLGNHLFSNAKALIFAGLFFEGEEADRWLDKGLSILAKEIPEQILKDGGQFESSPMYHALALEDMLDLCNVLSVYAEAVPEKWRPMIAGWPEIVAGMRRWLAAMCHPDGEIGFFNDAAISVAPSLAVLEQYVARLGEPAVSPISGAVTLLDSSGYIRVKKLNVVALLDVAPVGPDYLPAHAHADTLSFELNLFGQRVFVNSGTSCYGQSEERQRQRGTAAHNTVMVNGKNSSEVWAGFRVGRRAYPSIEEVREEGPEVVVVASHNGYHWLPGKNQHKRVWRFDIDSVLINDEITGAFQSGEARFHLHPDVELEHCSENSRVVLCLPLGQRVELSVEEGALRVEPSSWHPQFGVSVPSACVVVDFRGSVVKTKISWGHGA